MEKKAVYPCCDTASKEGKECPIHHTAEKCPIHNTTELQSFKKFTAGTEFVWLGWCNKCKKDVVVTHGNNLKVDKSEDK